MLRMKKCFLLKYKVKHSFNTAKLKCSTLSHKHTLGHRAGREQQEKDCPLEKGEFHVYLAVETQAVNEERFASSTSFRFYYTIKQMRKITTQKAVAMAI